ncbi:hypothetical protein GCM10009094_17390 [Massilia aurea]
MVEQPTFHELESYLARMPALISPFGRGFDESGGWWIKFGIDIDHPLAWGVVQELGHVLNYLSVDQQLPTVFKPVSPPPYLNGGPRDYLTWVIECHDADFHPRTTAEWLEGRLPRPVDDLSQWTIDD